MLFKRNGGKPFGIVLNRAEQKVLDEEINKQILEHDLQFQIDNDSAILEMLHVHFGFGPKRLKKAWKLFYAEHKKLREHYEMAPEDGGWLCRQRLLKIGVDVEQWYKEEQEENNETHG